MWNENTIVDNPKDIVAMQALGTTSMSLGQIQDKMTNFQNQVNMSNTPYFPLPALVGGAGLNSNTYAFSFAQSLGFAPKDISALSAPGSNFRFPTSTDSHHP